MTTATAGPRPAPRRPLTLGIDLGTTGTKVAILDAAGANPVAAVVSGDARLFSDHPGWAEADPDQWWENVCRLIPEALGVAGIEGADLAAVACSGMVPAVVITDGSGRPRRRAILQNDGRAGAEIAALAKSLEGRIDVLARTGSALTQQSVAPTLMWLARHEPDIWQDTAAVMGSYDWLSLAFGADAHVERNWATESGLYELTTDETLPEVLDTAGVDRRRLSPPRDPGTVVGAVSSRAAAATGLTSGMPIVVGGADHVLSAYAAGLAEPGDWLIKLGGAGDILVVTDTTFVDPRLYLDHHPMAGLWLPNGCMATSGSLIKWWQAVSGGVPMATLEAEAAAAAPAEILCLPYFLGEKSPLHDPDLRGAFFGLHLGHGRGDLHRAVLEAVGYGFRHHVDVLAERGIELGPARVSNGGSRSRVWKQIVADILGVPLLPIVDHPGASLGAAIAAAIGVGLLDDWPAGASLVKTGKPVEPDLRHAARYREAYSLWRELGATTTSLAHRLAERDRILPLPPQPTPIQPEESP